MPKEELQMSYALEEDFIKYTKESLKIITDKLDSLSKDLQEIKDKMDRSENQQNQLGKIESDIICLKDSVKNLKPSDKNQHRDSVNPTTAFAENITDHFSVPENETPHKDLDEIKALTEKQQHIQFWNQQLKFRRMAFWNMIKNAEKAKLYNAWLGSEPKVIPRKLQIPEIKGEPENQRIRRENLALEQFKTERDLLEMRGQYNEDKFKSIDRDIQEFWDNKIPDSAFQILMKMWKNECLCEEQKSLERWIKSEKWFQSYAAQFKKEHEDKNPFLKSGKFQPNNIDRKEANRYQPTVESNVNRRKYPSSRNQTDDNNRHQGRPQIPFHERPYKRNNNRQGSIITRKNSFLGYGPRQNDIR